MFPIHLNLGFKILPYYEGFYFLVSILVASLLALRRLRRTGLETSPFLDGLVWILLGSIAGARVFHFLFWDWASFRADPWMIVRFWEGGLSITGGLGGGFLSAWFVFRRQGLEIGRYAAALSPAVLMGQALGRVGCFLNGDAWGTPTHLPWGLPMAKYGTLIPGFHQDSRFLSAAWEWSVRKGFNLPSDGATVPLHPTQLYEAMGDLILAALVLRKAQFLSRHETGAPQQILWLHIGGYSLMRFGLEYLHGDSATPAVAGMTIIQIVMLGLVLVSTVLYWKRAESAPGAAL
jgi:phosphatidylglycerol:prolipoprotein diacylglycerol transferase